MRYLLSIIFIFAAFSLFAQSPCSSFCTGALGENIFPNGDFGSGVANVLLPDPKVAPGYIYQPTPPPDDGFYVITNNTSNWGSFAQINWVNIGDNSPDPNGYMMVVNASIAPGLFYENRVAVCENTLYEMSVDVISMIKPSVGPTHIPSNVAFLIDGQVVCETGIIPHNGQWATYRFSFTTNIGTDSVTLAFRNNAPGGFGNDLAIDNISFRACGPQFILQDTAYYCKGEELYLEAIILGSPYTTPIYQWQYSEDGVVWEDIFGATSTNCIVTGNQRDGYFRLLSANSVNNLALPHCRSASQARQSTVEDLSYFTIQGTDTTICNGLEATLQAGIFSEYSWSNQTFGSQITVSDTGWYSVTVTSNNGCTATDSIHVGEVEIDAALEIQDVDCFGNATGAVAVEADQSQGNLLFSLNDINYSTNVDFENLIAGDYTVFVQDERGCTIELPFQIEEPPALVLSLDSSLSVLACEPILIEQNSPPDLAFTWSSEANLSCSNCYSTVVIAEQDVWILLEAQNALGCTAADSIWIDVQPIIGMYAPNVFTPESGDFNRFFEIFPSKSAKTVLRFAVYDRWGELVFQRKDVEPSPENLRWNGQLPKGKKAANGVYVWYAEIDFGEGIVEQYSGDVLLLR